MKPRSSFGVATLFLLVVVSCAPDSATPPATSSSIDGTVVGLQNMPVAGVNVSVGSTTVTTDAAGSFTLDGVTPPYDVTVWSATGNWAHVFVGMSSPTPVLSPAGVVYDGPATVTSASITGAITTATPIDDTHPVHVCVEGVSVEASGCTTLTSGARYDLHPRWLTASNASVRVHALQTILPAADELPTGYVGYAVASDSTTLVPGNSYTQNLVLSPPPGTATLSGTVTAAPGVTSGNCLLAVRLTPGFVMPIGSAELAGATTNYAATVPAFPGASYLLLAAGSTATGLSYSWKVDLTAGSGRDVTIAGSPTAISTPISAGPGDTFLASDTGGAPLTVIFAPRAGVMAPLLSVTTAQASVTMPAALPVPSGAEYIWTPVTNPGEDLAQAAADALLGYVQLFSIASFNFHVDGGVALQIVAPPRFTAP